MCIYLYVFDNKPGARSLAAGRQVAASYLIEIMCAREHKPDCQTL